MNRSELDNLWNRNEFKTDYYNYIINGKFNQVNNSCVFTFKSVNYKTRPYFTIYGYCKHPFCKKFKILVSPKLNSEGIIKGIVFSNGLNFNHGPDPLCRHARGIERKMIENKLATSKPSVFRSELMNNASELMIMSGNLSDVRSVSVFKKIGSDAAAKKDRHWDDIFDVILMKRSYDSKTESQQKT